MGIAVTAVCARVSCFLALWHASQMKAELQRAEEFDADRRLYTRQGTDMQPMPTTQDSINCKA